MAQAEPLLLLQLRMGYGLWTFTASLGDGGARAREVLLEAVEVESVELREEEALSMCV